MGTTAWATMVLDTVPTDTVLDTTTDTVLDTTARGPLRPSPPLPLMLMLRLIPTTAIINCCLPFKLFSCKYLIRGPLDLNTFPHGDLYLIFLFDFFLPMLNCHPGRQGMSSSLHSSRQF